MTVATAVYVLPRRMAGWAARRSLAPNALTGIGLACSICAAGWFSAGTRLDTLIGGRRCAPGTWPAGSAPRWPRTAPRARPPGAPPRPLRWLGP